MKKIGLDLGSSSLGWAIRNDEKIEGNGVITFSSGMVKGQSGGYSSPTKDRREARSKRNLIKARKYRKWELLRILSVNEKYVPLKLYELDLWINYKKGRVRKFPESENFLKWLACDFSYEGGIKYKNPYDLRVKGLQDKLTNHEFGRVLYHLVQRRGYKDIGESDKETDTQIKRRGESGFDNAINTHKVLSKALKYEFLDKGKRARNEYPYRDEYLQELELICNAQGYDVSKNAQNGYKDDFVLSLWKAIIWQRPLRTQKGKIGKCTLEPSKPRCPVSHPIFEISRALQFINTIKFYNDNGEKQELTLDLKKQLYNDIFQTKDSFKFEDIRKYLDKKLKRKLIYNYPINKKTGKYETSVSGMPFCNGMIKILGDVAKDSLREIEKYNIGNAPKIINGYSILDIWHATFEFDTEYLETLAINKLGINNVIVKRKKEEISISPLILLKRKITVGYGDLSLKALRKIIPFLKQGYLYNDAVLLAKIPELLGENWMLKEKGVIDISKKSRKTYDRIKMIVGITNKLIDVYKGEVEDWRETGEPVRAWKDFEYLLTNSDKDDIKIACVNYFGQASWDKVADKEKIISEVGREYQEFFFDSKRVYREVPSLTSLFIENLNNQGIYLRGELYHHSNKKNSYGTTVLDKKTGRDVLPIPIIDSIKNPMFNKSMSVLRKLINELILADKIDEDTQVVVELARDLNDNNKRVAIERFQNERRIKREKIKQFLEGFKEKEGMNFNVKDRIRDFELWGEQVFPVAVDETGRRIENKSNNDILREKNAIKRYELWMEQKGQCMYTGKMISISQLFSNEIDIEHTVPRSLLPDNTMANLTVCYAKYNRDDKGKIIPFHCVNYLQDVPEVGTAISPRLRNWEKTRDNYKYLYESRKRPIGNEDEVKRNRRIQERHYYRMHFEYWKDKVERFTAEEIKGSWVRRQLVDTQMVSKYAREFLKTYFKKVNVQKGSVTADFRKIYGFQDADEIKSREKHTHHSIDAAVLTLIPTNSSRRDDMLFKMYKKYENERKQYKAKPFDGFDSQKLIDDIENNTLIVNYEKDKILQQTYRVVRQRGKIQYVSDTNGNSTKKLAQGDSVRSTLYKQTFLGKIRDVERYPDGQPKRNDGDWKYKEGDEEFIFTERKDLKDVLSKVDDIIDPNIKEIVRTQKLKSVDFQGNKIRHVRVKSKAGKVVKKRINYCSKYDYKNFYYSAAGSIPYALMLQKIENGKVKRKMLSIASFEIAKVYKEHRKFTPDLYLNMFHSDLSHYQDIKLLKVGQKVLVLNSDRDYENVHEIRFQKNRLYRITQFGDNTIYLKYHLTATKDDDIDKAVKIKKDEILSEYDRRYGLKEIEQDMSISDVSQRKKKFEDERYRFVGLKDYRFQRLLDFMPKQEVNELRKLLSKYKKQSSSIDVEGDTPLLKLNKEESWNFLFENYDFELSIFGELNLKS